MPEGHFHRSRIAQLDEDEEDEEDEDDDPCPMPVMQFLPLPLPLSLSLFLSFFLSEIPQRFLRDCFRIPVGDCSCLDSARIPAINAVAVGPCQPSFSQSFNIFQDASGFLKILQDSREFLRIFQDSLGFLRIFQDAIGFLRILE